ncbi:NADH:ubiquinone oxidoreductase [Elasticomyces elasticus]|nr:NADH:ubiquinone oxidoreductase [Elasticomyces elasticus]
MAESTSSPLRAGATLEEELAYYKAQYEQLEVELQEFQTSSKELEEELEKDVEASEKRERKLKEQVEGLGFEVDEWKTKYKQSKAEANSVQTTLQKEITGMRDSNRTLQLKLRDIEVANDDYERQARNTTSSLEDLESKLNVAIERGVMVEEDIKIGEQERESLRIETQRLRDELSDLRVEADITQEKLRLAEATIDQFHTKKPILLATQARRWRSPVAEDSGTSITSPRTTTPPPTRSIASTVPMPPSPPLSDASAPVRPPPKTPLSTKRKSLITDVSTTPRPGLYGPRAAPQHSRASSISSTPIAKTQPMGPPASRPSHVPPEGISRSGSLYQIRGLIGKVQKLEQRVHNARSKLPATTPSNGNVTPTSRASPRDGSGFHETRGTEVHASVTMRNSKKRTSNGYAPLVVKDTTVTEAKRTSRLSTNGHIKRLSFGFPSVPAPAPSQRTSRPSSRNSATSDTPPQSFARLASRSSNIGAGLPSSSETTSERPSSRSGATGARPLSRSSINSTRTPLGYATERRPRSSMASHHSHIDILENFAATPTRRTTLDKTGLAMHAALPKRQSGGIPVVTNGAHPRKSIGPEKQHSEDMQPPARRKLSGVGETF